MNDDLYVTIVWAIVGATLVGIVLSTKGCVEKQATLRATVIMDAASKGCVFVDGNPEVLVCPK